MHVRERISFKGLMSESYRCVDCGFDTAPGNLNRAKAEEELLHRLQRGRRTGLLNSSSAIDTKRSTTSNATTHSTASCLRIVHDHVWKAAGMQPYGGCLCIGCLETRIGRKLMPIDFPADAPLNNLPGTARLMRAKGRPLELGEFPEDELTAGMAP